MKNFFKTLHTDLLAAFCFWAFGVCCSILFTVLWIVRWNFAIEEFFIAVLLWYVILFLMIKSTIRKMKGLPE